MLTALRRMLSRGPSQYAPAPDPPRASPAMSGGSGKDVSGNRMPTVSHEEAAEIQRTYLNLIAARAAADTYRAKIASGAVQES